MFQNFPYTDMHQLNLDWIVKIAKDFLEQYTQIQDTISHGLQDLDEKEQNLEQLLQEWYDTHSQDIAEQLADALQDLNEWYTQHQNYLDQTLQDNIVALNAHAQETINSIPSDYTALQFSHDNMNSPNILDAYEKTDAANVNGITYAWNGTKCHISGTTTGASFRNIFADQNNLPSGISAGDIVYAGNINQVRSKLQIYYYTSGSSSATLLYNSLAIYQQDFITIPSNATGMIVRIDVDQPNGTTVNETVYPFLTKYPTNEILNKRTFTEWISGKCVFLRSLNNESIRTAEIQNALNTYRHVVLLQGDFYIDSPITIPAGGTLEGIGNRTVIKAYGTNVTSIVPYNNASLKNLTLDGGSTSIAAEGTRYGVYISNITQPVWIENCTIKGFNKYGIYIERTTGSTVPEFISNTIIDTCYNGLWITESEYLMFTNLCIRNCFRGCYDNGGNNKYNGCAFDSNHIGLQMTTLYTNNAHGSFVGCSFNHNTDYAIFSGNVTNGEVFSGCQFHFGIIALTGTTRGMNFTGCNFGQQITIQNHCTGYNYISNGLFYAQPTITSNSTGILKLTECYNFTTGEAVTN